MINHLRTSLVRYHQREVPIHYQKSYQLQEVHTIRLTTLTRTTQDGRSSGTTIGIYYHCEFALYTREPLR